LSRPVYEAAITHTVVERENLYKIARKYFGNPELWPLIFEANRDTLDQPGEIYVGQVLRIPVQPDTVGEPA
jgi:nucleoid-associated protein YgaU